MWTCFCWMRIKVAAIVIGVFTTLLSVVWVYQEIIILTNDNLVDEWVKYIVKNLVFGILILVTSIILIYGIFKERCRFILPWLIWLGFIESTQVYYMILDVVKLCSNGYFEPVLQYLYSWTTIIRVSLPFFWYAVFSLYWQLRMKKKQERNSQICNNPTELEKISEAVE